MLGYLSPHMILSIRKHVSRFQIQVRSHDHHKIQVLIEEADRVTLRKRFETDWHIESIVNKHGFFLFEKRTQKLTNFYM